MTEFEKTYQNYNPRQAALDEARALLTAAAKAAMADGALPEAELPAFIVEIPADTKNGDIASNIAMGTTTLQRTATIYAGKGYRASRDSLSTGTARAYFYQRQKQVVSGIAEFCNECSEIYFRGQYCY